MANATYRRIFDDVFVMTSAEKPIRRDVFALYLFSRKYVRCFIVGTSSSWLVGCSSTFSTGKYYYRES
jgi:hypothetical protein